MKTVLSQANKICDLEKLVLDNNPEAEIVEKGVIEIRYHEEYKYHQVFKLKPQKNPHD